MPRNRIKDYIGRMEVPSKSNQKGQNTVTQETVAYTYNASSGNVRVLYYPLSAEVEITNTNPRKQYDRWGHEPPSISLSPQEAFEISIYLLGLQPHIRSVLAQKDNVVQETPAEYPTADMVDQDI